MIQSLRRTGCRLLGALFLVSLPVVAAAQQIPQRPAGVSDSQLVQQMRARGLGDQIRQRIQQSGLTPDQVRARLRAAGYPENLVDAYLAQSQPGVAAPAPSLQVLRAAASLGLADFVLADTTALRDSIFLTRSDSFMLDTLGLEIGRDTIPTLRDSLGIVRLDTIAIARMTERLRRLRLFGLDVFRRSTNQFSALASGPVDAGYRVGPGDELVLILTGDVELAHELAVTREGFVIIPQVGQVFLANLTLEQVRTLLFTRLSRIYAGLRRGGGGSTTFDVTVTRLRVNQIFVNGEVVRPGAYPVSSVGTVMNALYQAGGPTDRGNFRGVRVLRAGRLVTTLDLYDYLIEGDTRQDIRLEQGDVVFVPTRGRRVSVEGAVVRPAIYELAEGEHLREVLALAGGLLPEAYTGRVQIQRILPPSQRRAAGRDRTVIDIDITAALDSGAATVRVEPEDRIRIFSVARSFRNRVTVRGNVWHPGDYQTSPGMRLSQLIATAGGVKHDTYLERAHVLRLMPDSTRRLIAVDLRAALDSTGGGAAAADVTLQEFDEVAIYSLTGFRPTRRIAVYGSVQRPGVIDFVDSMTLRDAVMLAGGLRDEAYLLEAEISRLPDTSGTVNVADVIRVTLDSNYVLDPTGYIRRATNPRAAELQLEPYDNVFIRRVPGWELQRNVVISGEVRFPGRYTLTRRDERILDVITRAGGLLPNAYPRGFRLSRLEGRAGRIGINLERVLRDAAFRDNLVLEPGDSMHVPPYQPVITVEGAVNSPVAVAFEPGRGTGYYIDRAGGFSRRADRKRTYVVQPNAAVQRANARPEPGARVVVPEIPLDEPRTNWAQVLAAVTTVLTSAVTLIVVLNR